MTINLELIFSGIVAGGVLAAGLWAVAMFVCHRLDQRFDKIDKRLDKQEAQHEQLQATLNDLLFDRMRRD